MTKNKLLAQWVEALRSGGYEQGSGSLRYKKIDGVHTFCCLGVLCDIYDNSRWVYLDTPEPEYLIAPQHTTRTDFGLLPDDISHVIELTREQETSLIEMNDGGKSFEEIAEWIENNLFELMKG